MRLLNYVKMFKIFCDIKLCYEILWTVNPILKEKYICRHKE